MNTLSYHVQKDNSHYIIIPLTQGYKAIVDHEDADLAMHHIILERKLGRPITKGIVVDHINGDGLDNRRENLHEATRAQNMRNLRLRSDNTSQYKGVKQLTSHTWEARVNERTVGYFDTAEVQAQG